VTGAASVAPTNLFPPNSVAIPAPGPTGQVGNPGASFLINPTLTNPDLDQFGGRLVPFVGDYIEVAAVGSTIEAVWTDQRDAVLGTETTGSDNDGADVAGDPETGGTCTSSFTACFDTTGGLNQNVYSGSVGG
jgi:hypothetical protein